MSEDDRQALERATPPSAEPLHAVPAPACPRCGSAGDILYADLADRHFDAPGRWSLRDCRACRTIWIDPRPEPRDLDRLYADYYTHDPLAIEPLFVRAIRRGIPARTLGYCPDTSGSGERMLGAVLACFGPLRELAWRGAMGLSASEIGELLDVGCGDGAFLHQMQSLGWSVSGVERDARGAEVAGRALGPDRIHPDLASARRSRPEGFDVLTLSHVIEHLLEPHATLTECLASLRPGGLLVVATPNADSRAHAHFGRSWLHLDPPRHVQLYRPATLVDEVRRAGFEIERLETPSSSAHFVWRASAEIARTGGLAGLEPPPPSARRMLSSLAFWLYEYTLTRMGRASGEELLLFARRPLAPSC